MLSSWSSLGNIVHDSTYGLCNSKSYICLLTLSILICVQTLQVHGSKNFRVTILKHGFKQSNYHLLFLHKSFKCITVLLVYVDDILISGDDRFGITSLKLILHSFFHMEDLRHLTYFFGLEVTPTATGIFLSQHKYMKDFIDMAQMTYAKPFDTPIELNVKTNKNSGELAFILLSTGCSSFYFL